MATNLMTNEIRIPVKKLSRKLLNLVTAKSIAESVPTDRALTLLLNELAAAQRAPSTREMRTPKATANA